MILLVLTAFVAGATFRGSLEEVKGYVLCKHIYIYTHVTHMCMYIYIYTCIDKYAFHVCAEWLGNLQEAQPDFEMDAFGIQSLWASARAFPRALDPKT